MAGTLALSGLIGITLPAWVGPVLIIAGVVFVTAVILNYLATHPQVQEQTREAVDQFIDMCNYLNSLPKPVPQRSKGPEDGPIPLVCQKGNPLCSDDKNIDIALGRNEGQRVNADYLSRFADKFIPRPLPFGDWPEWMLYSPQGERFSWGELTSKAQAFSYTISAIETWASYSEGRIRFNLWGLDPYDASDNLVGYNSEMHFGDISADANPIITLSELVYLRTSRLAHRIDYYYYDAAWDGDMHTYGKEETDPALQEKLRRIMLGVAGLTLLTP